MQTYWPHHVTLAYLAATEPRWQGDLAGKMEEMMMRYFFTHSKGGCMINEHHWIRRPQFSHYYRTVKLYNEAGTSWNYVGIVR